MTKMMRSTCLKKAARKISTGNLRRVLSLLET
jgi:hypothetical protein